MVAVDTYVATIKVISRLRLSSRRSLRWQSPLTAGMQYSTIDTRRTARVIPPHQPTPQGFIYTHQAFLHLLRCCIF